MKNRSSTDAPHLAIMERISDAFIALDADWIFQYVNTKAAEYFGSTSDSMIGKNIWESFPDCISQSSKIAFHKAMAAQEAVYIEEYHTRHYRWHGIHIYPSPQGVSVIVVGFAESIKKIKPEYESLFEQASDAIMITDFTGNLLNVNRGFCEMFGYSKQELLQMNVASLISPVQLQKQPLRFDLLAAGQHVVNERHMVTRDGSLIIVEANVKKITENRILAMARNITEWKTEAALFIKEKNLSDSLMKSLPGVFYLVDKEGKYIRWNKNFELITGYTAEEIPLLGSNHFIADEDKQKVRDAIGKVYEEGYAAVEAMAQMKDGTQVPYYLTGVAITYDNKPCLLGTGIDISTRVQAERSLKQSEANLHTILDTTDTAYVLVNKDLRIISFNQKAKNFSRRELGRMTVADNLSDFLVRETKHRIEDFFSSVFMGKSIGYESKYAQPDGLNHWYYIKLFPIANEAKEVFGLMLSISDITEQKRGEEAIRISNERYDMVAKATNDSIWDWNFVTNKITRNNNKLETLFGYNAWEPEEVDHYWNTMSHQDDWAEVTRKRNEIFNDPTRNYWEDEYRFLRTDGEYAYVYDRGYILRDAEGKPIRMIGASRDITERKKTEEALKEKNKELKKLSAYLQSVREAERKYIAREIHDELGQLASALKIDIDWLGLKIGNLGEAAQKRIDHANKTIAVLLSSIRKIASNLRPSVLDDFGLNAALKWHCAEFQNLNGIQCLFEPGFDDASLSMDIKTEFFRIAQESLTNVMRHAKASSVSVITREDAANRYLVITDNGNGFDTGKRKNTLGLIGLRERAISLDGKLKIESSPGNGTVISVVVPKTAGALI